MVETNDKYSMLDFRLTGKNIKIDFSKHLTKKEKQLFRYLKIQKYNHISIDKFIEIFGFIDIDEIIKFLNNLKSKSIIFSSDEKHYYIYLSIIQSFYINNNIVYLVFSDEISSAFKKGSFFENLGLNKILYLEEKFSYRLYQYICSNKDKKIYITIDELRDILEISNSYKRFYDLEKNFLTPIFEDIKKNTDEEFHYEKVKQGEYKGAKILGINIHKEGIDNYVEKQNPYIPLDNFMEKLKKHITNFSEIYSLLSKNLATHGEEYVKNKIDYVLENFSANIEEHLKETFDETDNKTPYLVINKKFKNLFELHSEILSFIHKHNLAKISTYMFPVKLYSLKDKQSLTLQDKNFTVKINYNKNSTSRVEFFINK